MKGPHSPRGMKTDVYIGRASLATGQRQGQGVCGAGGVWRGNGDLMSNGECLMGTEFHFRKVKNLGDR